jgi:hypothetical protein
MIDHRLIMKLWRMSRRTPSRREFIAICVAIGVIAAIVVVERLLGWPEMLSVNR